MAPRPESQGSSCIDSVTDRCRAHFHEFFPPNLKEAFLMVDGCAVSIFYVFMPTTLIIISFSLELELLFKRKN